MKEVKLTGFKPNARFEMRSGSFTNVRLLDLILWMTVLDIL